MVTVNICRYGSFFVVMMSVLIIESGCELFSLCVDFFYLLALLKVSKWHRIWSNETVLWAMGMSMNQ